MTLKEIGQVTDRLNLRVPKQYWPPNDLKPRPIKEIIFTGWKCSLPKQNMDLKYNEELAAKIDHWQELDYVGQFLYCASKRGPYFYVNLPGMQHGQVERGDSFDIGTERVYPHISRERMLEILEKGYELMGEVICREPK